MHAEAGLCQKRRRLLLAAALLHDVGHGPLSHTLEPVFAETFDVDHHSMTRRIVRGETCHGRAVYASLRDANLDPEDVLAMIDGHHNGPDAFLFASSINLDTLDGIVRSRAFMGAPFRAARHVAGGPTLGAGLAELRSLSSTHSGRSNTMYIPF